MLVVSSETCTLFQFQQQCSFGESLFSKTASSVVLTGVARPWSKSQEGSIWLIGYS